MPRSNGPPAASRPHLRPARTSGGLSPGQLDDLRACFYGLNTVMRLHCTQDEENNFSLAP
ncbi:hypothetical protein BJP40_06305 [Streptomyces sp. CC53]|uniref:hypothetical protein n=1 Tax=Streptomyces sp. CC53 TaxID=1906740 RepID=UPI0008DD26C6|nr:hypothetical protein [Streptomyces sp. CC53]OII61139.1 hypothetical protein BJP40_06305 [Streptomyces sp. CC53]